MKTPLFSSLTACSIVCLLSTFVCPHYQYSEVPIQNRLEQVWRYEYYIKDYLHMGIT